MKALILTGRIAPGVDQQQAWARIASLFKLEPEAFNTRILSRAPLSVRETDDDATLQRLGVALQGCGAEVELFEAEGKWFLQQGARISGPTPLSYLKSEFQTGRLASDAKVRQVDGKEWATLANALGMPTVTFDIPPELEQGVLRDAPPPLQNDPATNPHAGPSPASTQGEVSAIYVSQGGTRLGPFSEDEVKAKYLSGRFAGLNQVWHKGLTDWIALNEYAERKGWGKQAMPPIAPKSYKEYVKISCRECGFSGQMGVKGKKRRWWASNWLWGSIAVIFFALLYEINAEIQALNLRRFGTGHPLIEYVDIPWWAIGIAVFFILGIQQLGTKKVVDCPSCGRTLTQL